MADAEGLPNWHFDMKEVSAGVYKLKAVHATGPSIEKTGTNESKLIAEVKADALRIEIEIERKVEQRKISDAFRAARRERKRRAKWWSQHIPLAYITIISLFALFYFGVAFIDGRLPGWLHALGFSPAEVNLLLGTLSCGFGIWTIRSWRDLGGAWLVIGALCSLSGILTLAKAFAFI